MNFLKKHYKKLLILAIFMYSINIFVSQQKMLNTYNAEIKNYELQKAQAEEKNKSLNETKLNIDSEEYIEQVAREKLGMYLPNEKVYIDIAK